MDIVVENLTKVYATPLLARLGGRAPTHRAALNGVNLCFTSGLVGLLGPNGAGKTTLMRVMANLLSPTSGRVLVDGEDIRGCGGAFRCRVGYLPQDFRAYPTLKVREFLEYTAVMRGLVGGRTRRAAVSDTVEATGLTEVATRRIGKLSGGMHRRVGIAQAMLGPPELLIADEPTVGLDPEERIRVRRELARIAQTCTVILSTHIVGDVSSGCDRVVVMAAGEAIFTGSPGQLLSKAKGQTWETRMRAEDYDAAKTRCSIVRTVAESGGLRIRTVGSRPNRETSTPVEPSLEDAYVLLMSSRWDGNREAIVPGGDT